MKCHGHSTQTMELPGNSVLFIPSWNANKMLLYCPTFRKRGHNKRKSLPIAFNELFACVVVSSLFQRNGEELSLLLFPRVLLHPSTSFPSPMYVCISNCIVTPPKWNKSKEMDLEMRNGRVGSSIWKRWWCPINIRPLSIPNGHSSVIRGEAIKGKFAVE